MRWSLGKIQGHKTDHRHRHAALLPHQGRSCMLMGLSMGLRHVRVWYVCGGGALDSTKVVVLVSGYFRGVDAARREQEEERRSVHTHDTGTPPHRDVTTGLICGQNRIERQR